MRLQKYKRPSRSDHSLERRDRLDAFRSCLAASATGSSVGAPTPLRISHSMSNSGPANSRPSRAHAAKTVGASRTMSELSPAPVPLSGLIYVLSKVHLNP